MRSYKFDAERAATILTYLSAGAFVETAAAAAGVQKQTFYNWLRAGRAKKTPEMAKFAADVKQALAMFEVAGLSTLAEAGQNGQWQAMAWLLERKFPEKYGRRVAVESTGKDGGPIKVQDVTEDAALAALHAVVPAAEPGED